MSNLNRLRLGAFILDMIIITILVNLVSNTYMLNPYKYDYEEAYESYSEVYNNLEIDDDTTSIELLGNMKGVLYDLEKTQFFSFLWYLFFMFFYFVVFQKLNGGQTIGKKLFHVRVVDKNGENPGVFNYFLHTLFMGSSFYYGFNLTILLNVLALTLANSSNYIFIYSGITTLGFILEIIFYISCLSKKNDDNLNDKIAGIKAIME